MRRNFHVLLMVSFVMEAFLFLFLRHISVYCVLMAFYVALPFFTGLISVMDSGELKIVSQMMFH